MLEGRAVEDTRWTKVPIVCPHCGNHGRKNGEWTKHSCTPFKLVEDVVRSFEFVAEVAEGKLYLTADTDSDEVDWESGRNLRIECMQCFGDFPIPDGADWDFA